MTVIYHTDLLTIDSYVVMTTVVMLGSIQSMILGFRWVVKLNTRLQLCMPKSDLNYTQWILFFPVIRWIMINLCAMWWLIGQVIVFICRPGKNKYTQHAVMLWILYYFSLKKERNTYVCTKFSTVTVAV